MQNVRLTNWLGCDCPTHKMHSGVWVGGGGQSAAANWASAKETATIQTLALTLTLTHTATKQGT